MISMAGAPKNILPYSSKDHPPKNNGAMGQEGMKKVAAVIGGIWFLGIVMGYEWAWPVYVVLDILQSVLSTPPFSWLFGWILTPLSWIFSWFYRGAPLVDQVGALQELRLPADQVNTYVDAYVQQYGDAALIFATHDGYPQLVNALLVNKDLGLRDVIDAVDDNGNTALIYAAAKGFRQCTALLLRSGADPDIANSKNGGRTPLMEAAGGGHKDLVSAIRLTKATIDTTDDYGNTALHYAAYHGHLSSVQELLKGNPNRDIKNSYGHTPASYALANKHKGISDLINRYKPRKDSGKEADPELDELEALMGGGDKKDKKAGKGGKESKEDEKRDYVKEFQKELANIMSKRGKDKEEKHVKGGAEDLHKSDSDFAPRLEHGGISETEKKALEEQVAKLKRQSEESELKAQKRIVELLEKNSNQQKAVDDAEREARSAHLNSTELALRVQELESRHTASELRASDERQRADRLHEDVQRSQMEVDRHKSRADGAERERDLHMEAARRHEDNLRRKHEEVNEHLSRIERQSQELSTLREEARKRDDELRRHTETINRLQEELRLSSGGRSAPTPMPLPPSPPLPRLDPLGPTGDSPERPAPVQPTAELSQEAPKVSTEGTADLAEKSAPASPEVALETNIDAPATAS